MSENENDSKYFDSTFEYPTSCSGPNWTFKKFDNDVNQPNQPILNSPQHHFNTFPLYVHDNSVIFSTYGDNSDIVQAGNTSARHEEVIITTDFALKEMYSFPRIKLFNSLKPKTHFQYSDISPESDLNTSTYENFYNTNCRQNNTKHSSEDLNRLENADIKAASSCDLTTKESHPVKPTDPLYIPLDRNRSSLATSSTNGLEDLLLTVTPVDVSLGANLTNDSMIYNRENADALDGDTTPFIHSAVVNSNANINFAFSCDNGISDYYSLQCNSYRSVDLEKTVCSDNGKARTQKPENCVKVISTESTNISKHIESSSKAAYSATSNTGQAASSENGIQYNATNKNSSISSVNIISDSFKNDVKCTHNTADIISNYNPKNTVKTNHITSEVYICKETDFNLNSIDCYSTDDGINSNSTDNYSTDENNKSNWISNTNSNKNDINRNEINNGDVGNKNHDKAKINRIICESVNDSINNSINRIKNTDSINDKGRVLKSIIKPSKSNTINVVVDSNSSRSISSTLSSESDENIIVGVYANEDKMREYDNRCLYACTENNAVYECENEDVHNTHTLTCSFNNNGATNTLNMYNKMPETAKNWNLAHCMLSTTCSANPGNLKTVQICELNHLQANTFTTPLLERVQKTIAIGYNKFDNREQHAIDLNGTNARIITAPTLKSGILTASSEHNSSLNSSQTLDSLIKNNSGAKPFLKDLKRLTNSNGNNMGVEDANLASFKYDSQSHACCTAVSDSQNETMGSIEAGVKDEGEYYNHPPTHSKGFVNLNNDIVSRVSLDGADMTVNKQKIGNNLYECTNTIEKFKNINIKKESNMISKSNEKSKVSNALKHAKVVTSISNKNKKGIVDSSTSKYSQVKNKCEKISTDRDIKQSENIVVSSPTNKNINLQSNIKNSKNLINNSPSKLAEMPISDNQSISHSPQPHSTNTVGHSFSKSNQILGSNSKPNKPYNAQLYERSLSNQQTKDKSAQNLKPTSALGRFSRSMDDIAGNDTYNQSLNSSIRKTMTKNLLQRSSLASSSFRLSKSLKDQNKDLQSSLKDFISNKDNNKKIDDFFVLKSTLMQNGASGQDGLNEARDFCKETDFDDYFDSDEEKNADQNMKCFPARILDPIIEDDCNDCIALSNCSISEQINSHSNHNFSIEVSNYIIKS